MVSEYFKRALSFPIRHLSVTSHIYCRIVAVDLINVFFLTAVFLLRQNGFAVFE